jgi:Family of unknown function (DUF6076)
VSRKRSKPDSSNLKQIIGVLNADKDYSPDIYARSVACRRSVTDKESWLGLSGFASEETPIAMIFPERTQPFAMIRSLLGPLAQERRPGQDDKKAYALMIDQLRRYVDSWITEGVDWSLFRFSEWARNNGDLAKELQDAVKTSDFLVMGALSGGAMPVMANAGRQAASRLAERDAASLFLAILADPMNHNLRRCKYPSCQHYFVNLSGHEKAYCSRQCATRDSARRTMESRRERQKARKIRATTMLIKEWERFTTSGKSLAMWRRRQLGRDWKAWIVAESHEDLTKTWLTRAINRGWIRPPQSNVRMEEKHNGDLQAR